MPPGPPSSAIHILELYPPLNVDSIDQHSSKKSNTAEDMERLFQYQVIKIVASILGVRPLSLFAHSCWGKSCYGATWQTDLRAKIWYLLPSTSWGSSVHTYAHTPIQGPQLSLETRADLANTFTTDFRGTLSQREPAKPHLDSWPTDPETSMLYLPVLCLETSFNLWGQNYRTAL